MVVALPMEESPTVEWCKAQKISLSADLVEAAKKQLQFLAVVDSTGHLYDGPALERAIYRYKYCWLPLLAKHIECPVLEGPLVVPLDCEWIWHCHRLNPVQYKRDCEEIYGGLLDNLNVMSSFEGTSCKQTELLWSKMYGREPYSLELANVQLHVNGDNTYAEFEKNIDYDLTKAVKRQSSFFSKVSKLVHCDGSLFQEAVYRYKAFLHLIKKMGPRRGKYSCVPTHDIDLIWHSHQLNPIAYSKDLITIFGGILDHNDRDSVGTCGLKKLMHGFVKTKQIWEVTYDCMYSINKGLNRSRQGLTTVPKRLVDNGREEYRVSNYDDIVTEAEDKICWYNCWPEEESVKFESYSATV